MIKPLFQKVIVCYNGSRSSLHAVMYSIMMAKSLKCSVKVVYVVDTASIKQLTLANFMVKDEAENIQKRLHADGEKNMEYVTQLAKSKGVTIETQITEGAIWSEVIKAADSFKANLILLGGTTSGSSFSALKKDQVSGQNSEIIGSAHCSVMVVREPYIEQMFKIL